jgi:TetR/AcrR family transcriptional regulator, transcriptional repressor of bet genes
VPVRAADIVAARGVDALTLRDVATAAGYSTAIVSHYFADKRDLVLATYETAAERQTARFDAYTENKPMVAVLEALLPTSDTARRDWRLSVAFWGVAASDPHMTEDQQRRGRSYQIRIENLLRNELRRGPEPDPADLTLVAGSLVAFTTGIGMHATFDPGQWPARRQREALRREVTRLLDGIKTAGITAAGDEWAS